ncbi:hypothetical protein [Aureimonas sp. AU4]|uniref:hypothetical protein n=1 Tax=Aureimonas sp. AU4 TaxID=1638163 RepID=UPI00078228A7|nr:hypothetical protein [Aureimonas sp. AU4]
MSDLSRPSERGGSSTRLSRRQRDFLLLTVYVQLRHGYHERALVLAQALRRLGDGTAEVMLAQAVLLFLERRWGEALASLDELDRTFPSERFGSYRLNERQRMRRYLRSRCLFELGEPARARDALEGYLRHGESGPEKEEV